MMENVDKVKRRAARGRAQRVTGADIEAGRIRVPVTTETKSLLPPEPTQIEVVLKGTPLGACAYDPRYAGGHERSGVIIVDKNVLREQVAENELLPIVVSRAGVVYIGDRGSKLRIAQWVETKDSDLDAELKCRAPTLADFAGDRKLCWLSPRLASDYREFADDLWTELDLPSPDPCDDGFWPSGGPHWDAVARVEGPHRLPGVVLVEAKSHVAEVRSSCAASSAASRALIRESLSAAKAYIGASEEADWMTGYYQTANRYAFLYYLRARRNIPTWLFFVYFLGDEFEVDGVPQECPADEDGWKSTIEEVHAALGLQDCHPLSCFARNAFLRV